ncbi:glutathione S-transferase C-terminal domain-containing protein [Klebsiella variicola subsp. variicola]|nr:glutathione S-transferase C-terminal domain-containing protein [Klebsiella variicola subsp. variicola]
MRPALPQPAGLRRSGRGGLYFTGAAGADLGQHRYLTGNQLTEADIRLWTTLVRFDPVYVTHFKCDKRRISDYLNLLRFSARHLPDARHRGDGEYSAYPPPLLPQP